MIHRVPSAPSISALTLGSTVIATIADLPPWVTVCLIFIGTFARLALSFLDATFPQNSADRLAWWERHYDRIAARRGRKHRRAS